MGQGRSKDLLQKKFGKVIKKSLSVDSSRQPGLSRLVSQSRSLQETTSSNMISAVAGKTIETLIKQLIPNDKSHYLKSSWIENGKYI